MVQLLNEHPVVLANTTNQFQVCQILFIPHSQWISCVSVVSDYISHSLCSHCCCLGPCCGDNSRLVGIWYVSEAEPIQSVSDAGKRMINAIACVWICNMTLSEFGCLCVHRRAQVTTCVLLSRRATIKKLFKSATAGRAAAAGNAANGAEVGGQLDVRLPVLPRTVLLLPFAGTAHHGAGPRVADAGGRDSQQHQLLRTWQVKRKI